MPFLRSPSTKADDAQAKGTPNSAAQKVQTFVRRRLSSKRRTDAAAAERREDRAVRIVQSATRKRHANRRSMAGFAVPSKAYSPFKFIGDVVRRGADQPEVPIADPTPVDRWFTPRAGWPHQETLDDPLWTEPPLLMPTKAMAPVLFEGDDDGNDDAIGILRVELLQARALPKMDGGLVLSNFLGNTDPYAVIIFEGNAARVNACPSTLNPVWAPWSPRAFRFRVQQPYSAFYVSIKDEDRLGDDDDIGRVAVELGSLVSGTVYDSWFALQLKNYRNLNGQRGSIRLRYSVEYTSERARILGYLKPPRCFIVPFLSKRDLHSSKFAYVGQATSNLEYNFNILMSHWDELTVKWERTAAAATLLTDIIYWRGKPWHSVAACLGWQLLVSHPHYIPAAVPLLCCLVLSAAGAQAERNVAVVHTKPRLLDVFRALALGLQPSALHADPEGGRAAIGLDEASDSDSDLEAPSSRKSSRKSGDDSTDPGLDAEDSAVDRRRSERRRSIGVSIGMASVEGAKHMMDGAKHMASKEGAKHMMDGAKHMVDGAKHMAGSLHAAEKAAEKRLKAATAAGAHHSSRALKQLKEASLSISTDKVDKVLEKEKLDSKQAARLKKIAEKKSKKRPETFLQRKATVEAEVDDLMDSQEPVEGKANNQAFAAIRLTNPLAKFLGPVQYQLGQLVFPARAILRVVTWHDQIHTAWLYLLLLLSAVVLACVPWAFVLSYGGRLLGLLLLGPHMYYVGRTKAKAQFLEVDEETRFQAAAPAVQKAMLSQYRQELYDAAQEALHDEEKKQAKGSFEDQAKLDYLLRSQHCLSVRPQRTYTRTKYPTLPNPRLSRAYPRPKNDELRREEEASEEKALADACMRVAHEKAATVLQARVRGMSRRRRNSLAGRAGVAGADVAAAAGAAGSRMRRMMAPMSPKRRSRGTFVE